MTSKPGFDDLRGSGAFRSVAAAGGEPTTEIEQTRAELSETIDAIQGRLAPQGLAVDASDMVADATERSLKMAREIVEQTMQEATKQAKLAIVEISAQAQVSAREAAREMAEQAKSSVRAATIGKVERMATNTSEMAKQAATSGADKAKQAASSGGETAKGFGSTVLTAVKQNPWPAALTAVGIGWLVSSGGAKGGGTTESKAETALPPPTYGAAGVDADASGNAAERAKETTTRVVDQAQDAVGTALGRVTETTGEAVGKVAETAGGTVARVTETATGAVETVGSVLGGTASKVTSGATGLVSGVQQRAHRVSDMAGESPLKVGGTALAVGAVLGLALPVSRRETALIGEQRDNAIDRFEKSAQETLTKLQSVAQEAQEAAGKEAKYQGLAPETS